MSELEAARADLQRNLDGFKQQHLDAIEAFQTRCDGLERKFNDLRFGGKLPRSESSKDGGAQLVKAPQAWCRTFAAWAKNGGDGLFDELMDASRWGGVTFQAAGSVGSDPEGGYLVMPILGQQIQLTVDDSNPFRSIARIEFLPRGDAYEEPWDADPSSAWGGLGGRE